MEALVAQFSRGRAAVSTGRTCGMCSGVTMATVYCDTCRRDLCAKCEVSHRSCEIFSEHGLTPFTRGTMCGTHPDRLYTLYCQDCHVLLCQDCDVSAHLQHVVRRPHDVADIRQAALERSKLRACELSCRLLEHRAEAGDKAGVVMRGYRAAREVVRGWLEELRGLEERLGEALEELEAREEREVARLREYSAELEHLAGVHQELADFLELVQGAPPAEILQQQEGLTRFFPSLDLPQPDIHLPHTQDIDINHIRDMFDVTYRPEVMYDIMSLSDDGYLDDEDDEEPDYVNTEIFREAFPTAMFTPGICQADISQADMSQAGISQADISQAGISQAEISQAGISQAGISQADISQAGISQADISQADMSQAGISQAGISDPDISDPDISAISDEGIDNDVGPGNTDLSPEGSDNNNVTPRDTYPDITSRTGRRPFRGPLECDPELPVRSEPKDAKMPSPRSQTNLPPYENVEFSVITCTDIGNVTIGEKEAITHTTKGGYEDNGDGAVTATPRMGSDDVTMEEGSPTPAGKDNGVTRVRRRCSDRQKRKHRSDKTKGQTHVLTRGISECKMAKVISIPLKTKVYDVKWCPDLEKVIVRTGDAECPLKALSLVTLDLSPFSQESVSENHLGLTQNSSTGDVVVTIAPGTLRSYGTSGNRTVADLSVPEVGRIRGICYCANRDAYVITDTGNKQIVVISASSGDVISRIGQEKDFVSPVFVTCDNNSQSQSGVLAISDRGQHAVKLTDLEGNLLIKFGRHGCAGNRNLRSPAGVWMDPTGGVLVCDWGNKRVVRFSLFGTMEVILTPDDLGGRKPFSLDVTPEGVMIVSTWEASDSADSIVVFTGYANIGSITP